MAGRRGAASSVLGWSLGGIIGPVMISWLIGRRKIPAQKPSARRRGHSSYAAVVDLGPSITSTLVVVALGVAVLALVGAVGVHLRLSAIEARYRILWASGEEDVVAVLAHQSGQIANLHRDLEELRAQLFRTAGGAERSLPRAAVVRYDALGDQDGLPSFSAAIVDDRGDALVISSIHAPGESRTYTKGVADGDSDVTLTPEEQRPFAAARTGKGPE